MADLKSRHRRVYWVSVGVRPEIGDKDRKRRNWDVRGWRSRWMIMSNVRRSGTRAVVKGLELEKPIHESQ
jgi:hypothetical protein